MEKIVDTNVPLRALSSDAPFSQDCMLRSIEVIENIMNDKHKIVLDNDNTYIILSQYERNFRIAGANSLARKFLIWVYTNNANPNRVKKVAIDQTGQNSFAEVPQEIAASDFDLADLVFVAVALANKRKAPIVQSGDSKWIGWEKMLNKHGVTLEILCRKDLEAIYSKKAGK